MTKSILAKKCQVITRFCYLDEILGFDNEYVEMPQQIYFEIARKKMMKFTIGCTRGAHPYT